MTIKNLWGDINNLPKIKSPVAILNEQAQLLETHTNGLLIGRVVANSTSSQWGCPFTFTFSLNAPSLNNYGYTILFIEHDIGLYPIYLTDSSYINWIKCENVEQFEFQLEKILSSSEIRRVVSGLLSQIQTA